MGQEIQKSHFTEKDFERYLKRLQRETETLAGWFEQGALAESYPTAGFELEAWLVDDQFRPTPINAEFLDLFNSELASPELASFNVEVNSTPRPLKGHVFSSMHNELSATWQQCRYTARQLDADVVMTGILPTVANEDLNLANMSKMQRYRALNREVLHRRQGKPLVLDINGREHLRVTHRDVMLESAATSFQLHIEVAPAQSGKVFNASHILSAPMVAVSANSPYLFGVDLWDETRIPLFEQAVAVGGYQGAAFGPIRRVTFGSGYVRQSLMERFRENYEHYPVLLPVRLSTDPQQLPHLRLHNGTIWRWNRPLLGFNGEGTPHLRIEHRVVPSGPTVVDAIANAAFFYGTVTELAAREAPPETLLKFDHARDNFYRAAQLGLRAHVHWNGRNGASIREIILQELLPAAHAGLARLGVAEADRHEYLEIIEQRVHSGMNGATWQRAFVDKHGRDMHELTRAYHERQNAGSPVHQWTV